jgi:PAS domain S-box-containing protein
MEHESSGSTEQLTREIERLHAQLAELQLILSQMSGIGTSFNDLSGVPFQAQTTFQHPTGAALHHNEAFFRSLVENIPALVYSIPLRASPGTVYFNPQAQAISGISPEAWGKNRERMAENVHPEDRQRVMAEIARTLATGRPLSLEYRLIQPDQRIVWLHEQARLVQDLEGNPLMLQGVAQDISGLKNAEEQLRSALEVKATTVDEVHQGVKKNLQIMLSLFELYAAQVQDPHVQGFFLESKNRVHALALLHDNLCLSSDQGHVSLPLYLEALTGYLFDAWGISSQRIGRDLDITAMEVDMDTAMRLGLVVNELVSNALQHGFPGERSGRILLRVSKEEQGICLEVSDNGVGLGYPLDLGNVETMGLQLVGKLVFQAGGTVSLKQTEGTTFRFHFPVNRMKISPPKE